MQQITNSSLDDFDCNVTTELPMSITAVLNLANKPSLPSTVSIWNEFLDYSATECIIYIILSCLLFDLIIFCVSK